MSTAKNGRLTEKDHQGRWVEGNSGRPKGSRNKRLLAIESLFEGEAEAIARKAVEKALEGDSVALRMILDRISPAPKDRPVRFDLSTEVIDLQTANQAAAKLLQAVADGEVTPSEGSTIMGLLSEFNYTAHLNDIERRLAKIEGARS